MGFDLDGPAPDYGGSRPDFRTDRTAQDPNLTDKLMRLIRNQLHEANQMSANAADYRNRINRLSDYVRRQTGFDSGRITQLYNDVLGKSMGDSWHNRNVLQAGADLGMAGMENVPAKEFGGWYTPRGWHTPETPASPAGPSPRGWYTPRGWHTPETPASPAGPSTEMTPGDLMADPRRQQRLSENLNGQQYGVIWHGNQRYRTDPFGPGVTNKLQMHGDGRYNERYRYSLDDGSQPIDELARETIQ